MQEKANAPELARAANISLEDFTEVTFRSVLRAIDARNLQTPDQLKIKGPLIYGIWIDIPEINPKDFGPGIGPG